MIVVAFAQQSMHCTLHAYGRADEKTTLPSRHSSGDGKPGPSLSGGVADVGWSGSGRGHRWDRSSEANGLASTIPAAGGMGGRSRPELFGSRGEGCSLSGGTVGAGPEVDRQHHPGSGQSIAVLLLGSLPLQAEGKPARPRRPRAPSSGYLHTRR